MINNISRDIIVPGDITLHALHYVINRAFGWQNSHLHSFHPYEDDGDIYWDGNYHAGISVKNWLREKIHDHIIMEVLENISINV